jgi:hypothetical protein
MLDIYNFSWDNVEALSIISARRISFCSTNRDDNRQILHRYRSIEGKLNV